jgi:hypothetical protein
MGDCHEGLPTIELSTEEFLSRPNILFAPCFEFLSVCMAEGKPSDDQHVRGDHLLHTSEQLTLPALLTATDSVDK